MVFSEVFFRYGLLFALSSTIAFAGLVYFLAPSAASAATPTVSITAPTNSGNSCIGTPGAFTVTRSVSVATTLAVTLSYSGSAVLGTDYTPLSTTATIPANQTSVTVPVTALQKTSGGNTTLVATIAASSTYSIGSPASANMTINNGTTGLEVVSGYTPPAFATYQLPSTTFCHHWDNSAGACVSGGTSIFAVGSAYMSTWFDNSPAPEMCGDSFSGQSPTPQNLTPGCFSNSFTSTVQGVRAAALNVALPAWNNLSNANLGLDLTNVSKTNACNTTATHWAYASAPSNTGVSSQTILVPKYTPITVSYACQPNNDYVTRSDECMGWVLWWCGSWYFEHDADTGYQFANQAAYNGATSSVLSGTASQTVSSSATYSLQCGGYQPSDGTSDTGGLPPVVSSGSNNGGDGSYTLYNSAKPAFFEPKIQLTVQACSDPNAIVLADGVTCQVCSGATPYRSGNICIANPSPTATIDAGAGHDPTTGNGNPFSVVVGTPIIITATYVANSNPQVVTKTITLKSSGDGTCGANCWKVPSDWNSSNNTIKLWGGGGGGAGSGNAGAGGALWGGAGGNTSINLASTMTAGGGVAGCQCGGGAGNAGGTASGGDVNTSGGSGSGPAGFGGSSPNGGTGGSQTNGSWGATGGPGGFPGGGGGGGLSGSGNAGGKGGGGGAYAKKNNAVLTPGASVTYAIGGGGAGGPRNTSADGAGGAGAAGEIIITYTTTANDSLTATAINNDATGNSVDCTKVTPTNANCWTVADAAKTYTATTTLADLGTHTYSAQIKTNFYINYNSYAGVQVTVTCGPHSSGSSCTCDPHYSSQASQGGLCVLDECTNESAFPLVQATVPAGATQSTDGNYTCSCTSPYVPNGGICVPPGPPANLVLIAAPSRVRKGNNTQITWTGSNIPITCTLTSNPSIAGFPETVASTLTGNSTGVTVGPIVQKTMVTLTCTSSKGNGSAQTTVGTVPVYQEI